jgi:thiol-disulfide isomerase/thioredoxin
MKIKSAGNFIKLSLRYLLTSRSAVIRRQVINRCRLNCSLALILLSQLYSTDGRSQSTLQMSVPVNRQTVETFTFSRINTISGNYTLDTFRVMKGTGAYSLQIRNVILPGTGFIRKGSKDLREVFIAPGFPLQIIIDTTTAGQNEMITGAWKELDSVFRNIRSESSVEFNFAYTSLTSSRDVRLYDQLLKKIDTAIDARHRSLKDFLFYRLMRQAIDSAHQLLALNNHKTLYQPYLNQFAYGSFRNDIDRRYNYKLNLLTSAQQGKPAPLFQLKDTTGKAYSLENFKGKLVYIDLWASWCLPCRLETPYMHNIISRYNKRDDIAFIGVAVSDRMPDWKRALRQDRPRWLQLHDSNTFVVNAYAVTSVPRYVLIGKNGNVLDFNAPPPSQYAKLVAIIDKELSN